MLCLFFFKFLYFIIKFRTLGWRQDLSNFLLLITTMLGGLQNENFTTRFIIISFFKRCVPFELFIKISFLKDFARCELFLNHRFRVNKLMKPNYGILKSYQRRYIEIQQFLLIFYFITFICINYSNKQKVI